MMPFSSGCNQPPYRACREFAFWAGPTPSNSGAVGKYRDVYMLTNSNSWSLLLVGGGLTLNL